MSGSSVIAGLVRPMEAISWCRVSKRDLSDEGKLDHALFRPVGCGMAWVSWLRCVVAGVAGGALGLWLFLWLAWHHGLYGFAIPGGFLGLAAGIVRCPSRFLAVFFGLSGLVLGFYGVWKVFYAGSLDFGSFLRHAHHGEPFHLLMVGLGGLIAFWIPLRRPAGGRVERR